MFNFLRIYDEKEPSKAAVKGSEKQFRGLDKKKKQLQKLRDQINAIKHQFGIVDGKFPTTGMESRDQKIKQDYAKVVGKIPQEIKALKAQIDKMENPHLDSEEQ